MSRVRLPRARPVARNVLVDTCVWSLALRRTPRSVDGAVNTLTALIRGGRVVMLGAIRQEILSGIRTAAQFEQVREALQPFPDLTLFEIDYETAAVCFNRCRAAGIQGSNTDFLLCAVAMRRQLEIFTTDRDFSEFGRVLEIALYVP